LTAPILSKEGQPAMADFARDEKTWRVLTGLSALADRNRFLRLPIRSAAQMEAPEIKTRL